MECIGETERTLHSMSCIKYSCISCKKRNAPTVLHCVTCVIGKHPKLLISDNFHRVTSVIAFCMQEPLGCCSMSGNLQRNKTTRSITTLQSLLSFLFCDCDWSCCWMAPSQGESGKLHYVNTHVQLGQGSCNFLQRILFI